MPDVEVDVVVLGAGTAGLVARRTAERFGARALLVDPGPLGTTCARMGCMPSKLLVAAADAAHEARRAEDFGVHAQVEVDGRQVMDRVRRERDRFVRHALRPLEKLEHGGLFLHGAGRFVGPDEIRVRPVGGGEEYRVRTRTTVVATGARPVVPRAYRALGSRLLTHEDLFELGAPPASMLVVGCGAVGLEIGQALHRLGVRVTLLGLDGLIGPLDCKPIRDEAARLFQAELDLHPRHELHDLSVVDGGVRARFTDSLGRDRDERYARVLVAAGREPALAGLGLDAAGVTVPRRGAPTHDDATLQVGDAPIFLAGDACGRRQVLHEAADDGRIAGENAARWPDIRVHRRRTPLTIVFCDPQIAVVGPPWGEAPGRRLQWGEVDYATQGRARVIARNAGLVRIWGETGTGRLWAAEMLGPAVEHTAHLVAWAVQCRLTVDEALAMPFYHPVLEEGLRTALRDLRENLQIEPKPAEPCEEYGPGA